MTVFLAISSWDYVWTSWAIREASREAGGLPYPFVPILKSLIPATAVLSSLQGVANLIGSVMILINRMPPKPGGGDPQGEVI